MSWWTPCTTEINVIAYSVLAIYRMCVYTCVFLFCYTDIYIYIYVFIFILSVEVNEGGEEGEVTEDNNTNLEENESVLVHSDEGTVTVTYVAQSQTGEKITYR